MLVQGAIQPAREAFEDGKGRKEVRQLILEAVTSVLEPEAASEVTPLSVRSGDIGKERESRRYLFLETLMLLRRGR